MQKISQKMEQTLPNRDEVVKTIKSWMQERQEVLVSLNDAIKHLKTEGTPLSGLEEKCNIMHIVKLRKFVQNLIDYISRGHFAIFEKIIQIYDQDDDSKKKIDHRDIIEKITENTVTSLDFNDKYNNFIKNNLTWENLDADLSEIAIKFTERLELEDILIDNCYKVMLSHNITVQSTAKID